MAGVLKDILLVFSSMIIFGDPVTAQQFFGYSIALAGLMYYRLGAEKMQSLITDARLQVGDYRQKNPVRARAITYGGILVFLVFCVWSWRSPSLEDQSIKV